MTSPTPADANAGHEPSSAPQNTRPKPTTRVGTIVWGVILLAAAVLLIAMASGVSIDLELTLIIGLAVAGVALVIGSLIATTRRSRRRDESSI